jgi:hypothetical protein
VLESDRRDHSRAYKRVHPRVNSRVPDIQRGQAKPPKLQAFLTPPVPLGALCSRSQITLVTRGSRVRIPPSAWVSRAVSALLPSRVGGACLQNAVIWTEELFAGLRDCGRGRGALAGVELLEGVRVRAQAFLRTVARLARDFAGNEIPLGARIVAVCDAFRAMTSDRPYRSAVSADEAVAEVLRHSGTQFDAGVIAAFQAELAAPSYERSKTPRAARFGNRAVSVYG